MSHEPQEWHDAAIAESARLRRVGPWLLHPPPTVASYWLERNLCLQRYLEYTGPLEVFSLYTVPRSLRPSDHRPVVRKSPLSLDLPGIDVNAGFFEIERDVEIEIDGLARNLINRLNRVPTEYESIDSRVVIDYEPAAELTYSVIHRTRHTFSERTWCRGASPELDSAWEALWSRFDAHCAPDHARHGYVEAFDIPPDVLERL